MRAGSYHTMLWSCRKQFSAPWHEFLRHRRSLAGPRPHLHGAKLVGDPSDQSKPKTGVHVYIYVSLMIILPGR